MTREPSSAASDLVQSTLLGELLENARIGALAIESGRYVAANAHACELTGYPREELIGRRVGDVPHQFAELLQRRRDGGVLTIKRKDGVELEVSFRTVETMLSGLPLMLTLFSRV
jgi:PAS domain S-box-containing protein